MSEITSLSSHSYQALNEGQRRYVENRLKGQPPLDAALAAGYSESYAKTKTTLLERHPVVKTILREAGRSALRELCLTREHVLHGLMDAVDGAATATELTNAWREIGRVIGAYEPDKVQIDVNNVVADDLRTMSVEELAALADMQGVIEGSYRKVGEEENLVG